MIHTSNSTSIRGSESGAVLIVVLLVLILITLIGTIAIQRSTTDLKLATASQINKLTFQSTDAAFNKLEKEDRSIGQGKSVDNVRGYVTRPGKLNFWLFVHSTSSLCQPTQSGLALCVLQIR